MSQSHYHDELEAAAQTARLGPMAVLESALGYDGARQTVSAAERSHPPDLFPDVDEPAMVLSAHLVSAHAVCLQTDELEIEPDTLDEMLADVVRAPGIRKGINARDSLDRIEVGLALRREIRQVNAYAEAVDEMAPPWMHSVEMLARWLSANPSDTDAPGGHLARWAIRTLPTSGTDPRVVLGRAWWAAHGLALVRLLARELGPLGPGRPPAENAKTRDALALSVARTFDSLPVTKSDLATQAGVTRTTLDAWLTA